VKDLIMRKIGSDLINANEERERERITLLKVIGLFQFCGLCYFKEGLSFRVFIFIFNRIGCVYEMI
jgi:hypothetical protein